MLKDKLTPKAIVAALERAYRRPGRRQEGGRGRAPQPLAPAAAVARAARRGHAQEHPDDRPHRLRQDRDQPAAGEARRRAVREGRGDQVHRGRLCRPRRRADRPRPRRGSGPARARAAPQQGPRRGRGSGDGQAARRAHRQGFERGDAPELPPALHRRQPRPGRGRDRGRRAAGDAVRDPRHGRAGVRPEVDHGQGDGPGARARSASSRCPRRSPG